MRKKIKILSYLSIVILMISSCEVQEDYIEETSITKNFKRSSKNYNELITEKDFSRSFSKIPKRKIKKTNSFGRTQMEDTYGFTIYDTPINIMESDSLLVYNLLIKSDTLKTGNYFENLVLNTNKFTNETKAYIFKYNLSSEIVPTIHNSIHFTANVAIKPIIYSGNIMARYGDICYTHHYTMCYETVPGDGIFSQPHQATEYCTKGEFLVNFNEEVCIDSQGGGATSIPTTTTSGSSSSGSSYGSSGGTPIYSNPTPPCDPRIECPILEDPSKTPCDKIKTGTGSTQFMNSFNNINKPEKLALPFEYGFAQVINNYVFSQATGSESIPIPNAAKNYTHTHPNRPMVDEDGNLYHGNVKIHSPDDIYQLILKCQRNNRPEPTNTFGIAISDEGIFALTILEPIIFDVNMQNNWKDFEDKYLEKSREIISNNKGFGVTEINIRKEKLQKMLLSLLKDLGLENKIGLFEGTVDNNSLVPKINWQRKKINTSGNLTSEDC